ncbi:four helix bundle protein [Phocaeicola sp. HCN-40430]|uniref:four helix bundle protein n=1 Tax=Phocaeicola sp. HCN-40430 TaxID=3134664 RepID=UPI0030BF5221
MGKENIIMEKAFHFAVRIVNLHKLLYNRKEFVLSQQLLRSGTAIGALLKESEHAESTADFIHKLNIALKEANESEYWIMLLQQTDYISKAEYDSIIEDCREIIRMLISIIKTCKTKSK